VDYLLERVLERLFPVVLETATTYPEWRRLVIAHGVSGVQVHDARLVALMLTGGLTRILTFDTADFARYTGEGIVAVDPGSV
jgi:predicted nucleic acid-binding protein